MYDNGLGYPDITKYDGVYSGYLPKHASIDGYYSVIVQAQDNGNTFTLKGISFDISFKIVKQNSLNPKLSVLKSR